MSRGANIKWRGSDSTQLSRLVANFNRTYTLAVKKYGESVIKFLPERINVADIKAEIKTRADYNRIVKELSRASLKTFAPVVTPKGVTTTKYEIDIIRNRVARINRERKKELEMIAPSPETGSMGSIATNNLKPKKFDLKTMTRANWPSFKESVIKQSKSGYTEETHELYKSNYLKAVHDTLGSAGDELYDYVSQLPASFVYYIYSVNENVQIEFIYTHRDAMYIAERALNAWRTLNNDTEER